MKRSSRHVGLGLVCVLFLAAGCGGGNGATTPTRSLTDTGFINNSELGDPFTTIACGGDCNLDESVTIDELIVAVNIALGSAPLADCVIADSDGDGTVTVNEVIIAVNHALNGCSSPTNSPTVTPTTTSSPTPTPTATFLPGEMAGRLDLDIRWSADVVIRVAGSDLTARLTLSDAREVAVAGVALEGAGNVHDFTEADAVLYTARFASPPIAGGRCGSDPTSLSLTLFRRGGNGHVEGGIAVYCGANTYSGNPARMLRLAGVLPIN